MKLDLEIVLFLEMHRHMEVITFEYSLLSQLVVLAVIILPMNLILNATMPCLFKATLSEEIDIYATEQESAIRVKDGKIEIMGSEIG